MSTAPCSGVSRPRIMTIPSASGYTCRARPFVAPALLTRLGHLVHPAPAANDPLDLVGAAGPADREQPLLRLGRRYARQRPNLGVRELAAGERIGDPR